MPILAALATSLLLGACATPQQRGVAPVTVGIVAINDFHGALEPPRLSVGVPDGQGGTVQVPAGGAAWLASAIDSVRARYRNSVTVAAGDLISASQVASSIHLDEPAIGVMNRAGLEFSAVGNHEFDQGRDELLRKQNGGCAKFTMREPCQIERFAGADYRMLAASTFTEQGRALFPATGIKRFGKGARQVSVGFVGLTLKGTDRLVSPDGIAGLTFGDEAEAINRAVPALKAEGADAVVVLIHQGGKQSGLPDPNGCDGLAGALLPILDQLDPRVDLVVSGHTHQAYVCDYRAPGAQRSLLVTSAGYYGQIVTDIAIEIDPRGNRVVARRARNIVVQSPGYTGGRGSVDNVDSLPRFTPRADVAAYVGRYVEATRVFSDRVVGRLTGPAERDGDLGGALGNLIADAQLGASRKAGAQIALTNPFGLRAMLVPGADGTVTFGDLYRVQPFGNTLVTQTMTGAELRAVLEQGLDDDGPIQVLSPSAGLTFRFDPALPSGHRIVDIALDGEPLDPAARYRVTTNSFLAGGGDGFTGFVARREAVTGTTDLEALEAWLAGDSPRAVPDEVRATIRR